MLPHHFRRPGVMSEGLLGPNAEAPAPSSPGLVESGGEYGCAAAVNGERERGQPGVEGVGGVGLSDPCVTGAQEDPWARYAGRVRAGAGAYGPHVGVPLPPSSGSSTRSAHVNPRVAAPPGLSAPVGPMSPEVAVGFMTGAPARALQFL